MRNYGLASLSELYTNSLAPWVRVCKLELWLKIAFQGHHEDALGVKAKAHLGSCSSDYLTSCLGKKNLPRYKSLSSGHSNGYLPITSHFVHLLQNSYVVTSFFPQ